MNSQSESNLVVPHDDQWLAELDALLLIETVATSASFQAVAQVAISPTLETTPRNSSEDGDGEPVFAPQVPDRRKEYRQKNRQELLELRGLSTELQAKLDELWQRRKTLETTLGNSTQLVAGWRGIALRQMQRRLASESVNRDLRRHIRSHHENMRSLTKALRAEMVVIQSKQTKSLTAEDYSKPVMRLNEKDMGDISVLLRDVNEMCVQALSKIQQAQMPLLEETKTYNSKLSQGREIDGVQSAMFAETMTIPFPVEESIPAMAKAFPLIVRDECVPAISPVSEDVSTAAVKFVWGQYEVLSVTKFIGDSKQATIAWRSIIRERGKLFSAPIAERGWGCAVATDESSPSTQLRFLSHWEVECSPTHETEVEVPSVNLLDRFSEMYVGSSESIAAELVKTLENEIFDMMIEEKRRVTG